MKNSGRLLTACLIILFTAINLYAIEQGETVHGFTLVEKRFVKEVNAECMLFKHDSSGARLFKIAADDPNKLFSISFKTVCNTDAGTPHILEHSVLNGSKNFPVKSPFDVLSKGSLNTFLNAMTGNDVTMYPVASMNDKDYFNLMHVYLDAVFNPLIYDDPMIFKQEGWHRELADPDGPIVYKGVVYNEMKGAFSSPTTELYYQTMKHLFPDTPYNFSSGGYPEAIPTLRYEQFLDFHRKHYHPENSYILLYGNADLDKELAFIDAEYLSNYRQTDNVIELPLQAPFDSLRQITKPYPIAEGADPADQTFLALNWAAGEHTDSQLLLALRVLMRVLVYNEAGPVRVALQDAGIGRDVGGMLEDLKQNIVQIRVQNANPEDTDRFREVVYQALEQVAKDGVDREAVAGALHRQSFSLREGNDAQKGLTYNWRIIGDWFWAEDPFNSLEFEKTFAALEAAIPQGYLEDVIREHFLENPHVLQVSLVPDPGLENRRNQAIDRELADYKVAQNHNNIEDMLTATQNLMAKQAAEDSPEALATIPLLALDDINPEAAWYPIAEKKIRWIKVPYLHYDTFCNDVVYTRLFFDMRVLPQNMINYAALLAEVMGALNTSNYSYGDLDKALDLQTGGFNTYISTYLAGQEDEGLIPKFTVSSKALNTKLSDQFDLLQEIITLTRFDDFERLEELLVRHQSQLEARVRRDGLGYAITRMQSYYRTSGVFNESTRGLDYYWFITDLVENFDQNRRSIATRLAKTAEMLFTRENMMATVTATAEDAKLFKKELKDLAKDLPRSEVKYQTWRFKPAKANEGLLSTSKVQYVVQGYDYKQLGYEWDGHMRVMGQILSRDFIHNQVRVIGGAYGGWVSLAEDGTFYFGSYRDPNLAETLENYDKSVAWLKAFDADDQEMTRFIIGTIARIDRPYTPPQEGNMAVRYWFEGRTPEQIQTERDAILATTPEQVAAYSKMVADILAKETYVVYGNEAKLQENADLFGKLVNLSE